ncbi:hypothetical protein M404DRAFT_34165 [Pisolithus tinctorius Marx 270]|uniref:Uncharacterized protein n=1 Tax=Pisolithus tinctorius Marx 270 TaxID=870435 RepID=A0A0C3NIB3_PISTI|nr:hypothetical protein M404DRAFT_34165 [Pisolithus tinctorius Marx 270]
MPPVRSQHARSRSIPPLVPHPVEILPLLSSQAKMVYQQVWHVIVGAVTPVQPDVHSGYTQITSATVAQSGYTQIASVTKDNSSLTSLESIELTTKIWKPPGEVGHPGRGGYNLEEHLRWSDDEMRKLKRVIHTAVKKYLNMTKSRSYQDFKAVQKVTGIARQQFPRLEDYEHCWPVIDMIHLRLKYLSSRHRQKIRRDSSPE